MYICFPALPGGRIPWDGGISCQLKNAIFIACNDQGIVRDQAGYRAGPHLYRKHRIYYSYSVKKYYKPVLYFIGSLNFSACTFVRDIDESPVDSLFGLVHALFK